ncbi:YpzG family protein [Calidifontibacillus erzurumensis]|uniref:YpzG family protein n=1 Tax=Calidifontibacillus erzurumensis TaxID=2741433 RepID=A0A8J8KCM0_9BACI|nr:YpzG family protein [Calidifontibacillus erzurumensis]NSL52133.1 YpzG family protein [Calidifontibacillus erzurumensis]
MGKYKKFYDNLYKDPFLKGHANPKHSWHQINGETRQTVNQIILETETRKRS